MDIFSNRLSSIEKTIYCERYINNGSPSGFTFVNTTSIGTRAFDKVKKIKVPIIDFKSCEQFFYFGKNLNGLSDNQIIIHPDLLSNFECDSNVKKISFIDAVPLASNRTVFVPKLDKYIKLQYNGLIGRMERYINFNHVNHSIIINNILHNLNWDNTRFHFFAEEHARIYCQDKFSTIGMNVRESEVFPSFKGIVIPAFSLFSKDINNLKGKTILLQLIDKTPIDKNEFVLYNFIEPVISLYFKILLETGLQIEAHSQNICYIISDKEIEIAVRDFESFDKDLEIATKFNNEFNIEYKCFSKDNIDYTKRHSFMFDFKLGEYLITPILAEALKAGCDVRCIVDEIKRIVNHYIQLLPEGFFPSDCWYSFPKSLIDRTRKERPYVRNDCPKYR